MVAPQHLQLHLQGMEGWKVPWPPQHRHSRTCIPPSRKQIFWKKNYLSLQTSIKLAGCHTDQHRMIVCLSLNNRKWCGLWFARSVLQGLPPVRLLLGGCKGDSFIGGLVVNDCTTLTARTEFKLTSSQEPTHYVVRCSSCAAFKLLTTINQS